MCWFIAEIIWIHFMLKNMYFLLSFLLLTPDLQSCNWIKWCLMWIKETSKTNAETYSDFFFSTIAQRICYISCVHACIYTYTLKQIKVIFYRSQQDMIFPFNDSSKLTLSVHQLYRQIKGMCTFSIVFFSVIENI